MRSSLGKPSEKRRWFAIDDKGVIHQFHAANGKMHWAGDSSQNGGILELPIHVTKRLEAILSLGKSVKSCL